MSKRRSDRDDDFRLTLGFIWSFLAAYPTRSVVMVALLAVAGLAEGVGVVSILPVLEVAGSGGSADSTIGQLVTDFVRQVGLPVTLPVLLGVIVSSMLAKAVFLWIAMRSVGYTMAEVTADLRLKLLDALLHAKWLSFAERSTGELANALGTEAQRASSAFREAAKMLGNIIIIGVYTVASFLLSWQATSFAILAGLVFILIFNRMVAMSRDAGRKQTYLLKSLTGRFVDALSGLKAIKAMALESQVFPLLQSATRDFSDAQKEQVIAAETQRTFKEPVITLFLAAGIVALIAIGETISKVLVLAFIAYRLLGIIANVQASFQGVVNGESAFWSLQGLLDELRAQAEPKSGTRTPPPLDEGIRFEGVGFSYGEGPVVADLDMFVPANSFVALTGESGSGKTTIADLILGLHVPDAGTIYIDDVPLDEIALDEWRSTIGYVPQEALLLHDSVLTNLTFGDPSFTEEDVRRALAAADALDFVMEKPEGLETVVGEKGAKLSGGQRQRIAIARALLRRPRLLILDEPTTALDPETEQQICETLASLGKDLTILAISHQSAIQEVAETALHLEGGKVTVHEGGDRGAAVASR